MLRYTNHGHRNFDTWPVPPCQRWNWEFYAITEGMAGPYFLSGKSPAMRSEVLWTMPAMGTFGWRGNGNPCHRVVFHFSDVPKELRDALGEKRYLAVPLTPEEQARLLALAKELEDHWKAPHQYSHLVCEKALLELTLLSLKLQPAHREIPLERLVNERVERALTWFTVNMAANPDVKEVAGAMNMSEVHLRRLFRQTLKESPHSCFRKLQIKRAAELLSTTQLTLENVALQCGFKSATDFSRVFRLQMQTTPDAWRKSILTSG